MSRVTIRDLAAACGVSIGTVSKALRHSDRISAATAARIEEKAKELGYVADHAARALSSSRRRVAVVLPATSVYIDRYREGCCAASPLLSTYGITLHEVTPEEAEDYDAVLVHPSLASRLAVDASVPIATVGGRAPSLHPIAEVMPDHRIGGRLAAQFLAFATGGGSTAVLTARRGAYGEEEAVRGFRELSSKLSIPVASVIECGDNARSIMQELRRLTLLNPRLRGVFVAAPIAAGVATAAGELRRKLTVVGADFTRPAQDALRAGSIAALLYPAPDRQAEKALTALAEALTGGRTPGILTVRQELVLKSNLESYL